MDLATLIKPILASGELRVVGSTTFDEFKHIEKDRALARRLQKIVINEPTIDETAKILEGLRSRYEAHHMVTYTDDALSAAAKLASRHLRDSRLPDSAIDVVDEAGAVLALQRPEAGREQSGEPDTPKVTGAEIERIVARMARIPENKPPRPTRSASGHSMRHCSGSFSGRRMRSARWGSDQASSRRSWTAGPTVRVFPIHRSDRSRENRTRQAVGYPSWQRVYSLRHERIHGEARRGAADRRTAGYVGFEQGGFLVDAVRTHPYSVVLLDEIEKAHQDVYNILLQVMDHATLTDNSGRKADFRHVVLIMTSNAGSREASTSAIGLATTR